MFCTKKSDGRKLWDSSIILSKCVQSTTSTEKMKHNMEEYFHPFYKVRAAHFRGQKATMKISKLLRSFSLIFKTTMQMILNFSE